MSKGLKVEICAIMQQVAPSIICKVLCPKALTSVPGKCPEHACIGPHADDCAIEEAEQGDAEQNNTSCSIAKSSLQYPIAFFAPL